MGDAMSEHETDTEASEPDARATGEAGAADPHAPIVHELDVHVSRARAFDAYVHGLGEWWHPGHTASGTGLDRIHVDAHEGGRIVEHARDGAEHVWGEILELVPGERFAHTFGLSHDDGPTEVVVTFAELEHGGTRVRLEHGGWGAADADARGRTDWTTLLERYVAYASHV